jgi:hypothetical protein
MAKALVPASRSVLDVLNVKYLLLIIDPPEQLQQVTAMGFVPRLKDGLFQVLQNQSAWSRAYLAKAVLVNHDPKQLLEGLGTLRPGEALIEDQVPEIVASDGDAGSVERLRYDFDRVEIRTRASRPSLLVLGENYDAGWSATVQGKPARIIRANYAFQAVAVPAGIADIKFSFVPVGLHAGLGLSAGGLVLVVLMFVWGGFRKKPAGLVS